MGFLFRTTNRSVLLEFRSRPCLMPKSIPMGQGDGLTDWSILAVDVDADTADQKRFLGNCSHRQGKRPGPLEVMAGYTQHVGYPLMPQKQVDSTPPSLAIAGEELKTERLGRCKQQTKSPVQHKQETTRPPRPRPVLAHKRPLQRRPRLGSVIPLSSMQAPKRATAVRYGGYICTGFRANQSGVYRNDMQTWQTATNLVQGYYNPLSKGEGGVL